MGITHHSNYIRWMEEARTVKIEVQVKEIRPVKVFLMYIMRNEMENIVATAESSHALSRGLGDVYKRQHVMRF